MDCNENEVLWSEKYRPKTIDDCILPERYKKIFNEIVSDGIVPNMMFSGQAGVGKTTVAMAIAHQIDASYLKINASADNGIDVVREDMLKFATRKSITGKRKILILDEADELSKSAQPALRSAIEDVSKNCSFIMTCNNPNRIIEPLHSRCRKISFSINKDERKSLKGELCKRMIAILKAEGVEFDMPVLAKIIETIFPDNRKIINTLQTFAKGGKIDEGILPSLSGNNLDDLIGYLKGKQFPKMLQWCAQNADNDLASVYSDLYGALKDKLTPATVPELILTLAEQQKYHAQVPDIQIHLAGMFTELMGSLEFK